VLDALDGISLKSFGNIYAAWVKYCFNQRATAKPESSLKLEECELGGSIFNLCYSIGLLARTCLIMNPSNASSTFLFLQRFHALFKGDIRISSTKDEFVLADVDILHKVLGPAIRMSLRLHQDHLAGEDFDDVTNLYTVLEGHDRNLICCHEGDPLWRESILKNTESMLSLRKHVDANNPDNNDHLVLLLTLRYMKFRVIKLNREGVRGLWAGQQQELVFLGNTNSERGSIQQLKTVARNLVNQSCDFPVGYPIYVSPLATSYSSFWPDVLQHKVPNFMEYLWSSSNKNKAKDEIHLTQLNL